MIADRGPVRAAYDANVLDGKNSEEKVLIGPIVPVLIHLVQQRGLLFENCYCRARTRARSGAP